MCTCWLLCWCLLLPCTRLGLGHPGLFQAVVCTRCPDFQCVILLVSGVRGIVFHQWFSFIPVCEVTCVNTDIRKPGTLSIAENGQNAVTSKTGWSGFLQIKNVTTDRKPQAKILCVRVAAPLQKGAAKLLGSFERCWWTDKRCPVERKYTSPACLAARFLRYQNREEITSLYFACLRQRWTEARIACQSPSGVQMEVL